MSAVAAVLMVVAAAGIAGARVFKNTQAGIAVAALVGTMPLLLRHADLYAVLPLIAGLAWLATMDAFERTGRAAWLVSATAVLGLATGLGATALITMPLLFAATMIVYLTIDGVRPVRLSTLLVSATTFAAGMVPTIVFLAAHPEWYRSRIAAYGLYDAERFNVLQGAREMFSWLGIAERSAAYWRYIDPSFLFLSGPALADAIPSPAVFLTPLMLLLPLGITRALASKQRVQILVVLAFLLAPVAGALVARPPASVRILIATPFAGILAYGGLLYLRERGSGGAIAAAVLAAAVAGQALLYLAALTS